MSQLGLIVPIHTVWKVIKKNKSDVPNHQAEYIPKTGLNWDDVCDLPGDFRIVPTSWGPTSHPVVMTGGLCGSPRSPVVTTGDPWFKGKSTGNHGFYHCFYHQI